MVNFDLSDSQQNLNIDFVKPCCAELRRQICLYTVVIQWSDNPGADALLHCWECFTCIYCT